MKSITTEQRSAIEKYNSSNQSVKDALKEIFGEQLFAPPVKPKTEKSIMDKVKCLADAIKIVKPDKEEKAILNYKGKNKRLVNLKLHLACVIIAKALCEEWTPDWSNSNEYKYYAWFEYKQSGFVFAGTNGGFTYATTYVGSRLFFFKNRELAAYFGKMKEVAEYMNS